MNQNIITHFLLQQLPTCLKRSRNTLPANLVYHQLVRDRPHHRARCLEAVFRNCVPICFVVGDWCCPLNSLLTASNLSVLVRLRCMCACVSGTTWRETTHDTYDLQCLFVTLSRFNYLTIHHEILLPHYQGYTGKDFSSPQERIRGASSLIS